MKFMSVSSLPRYESRVQRRHLSAVYALGLVGSVLETVVETVLRDGQIRAQVPLHCNPCY